MSAQLTTSHVLEQFEAAVAANAHITDVDQATVELGRAIASSIDTIVVDPEATPTERTKALYLAPHLVSILKELLATPLARKQVGVAVNDGKKASRLSLIQASAAKKAS